MMSPTAKKPFRCPRRTAPRRHTPLESCTLHVRRSPHVYTLYNLPTTRCCSIVLCKRHSNKSISSSHPVVEDIMRPPPSWRATYCCTVLLQLLDRGPGQAGRRGGWGGGEGGTTVRDSLLMFSMVDKRLTIHTILILRV